MAMANVQKGKFTIDIVDNKIDSKIFKMIKHHPSYVGECQMADGFEYYEHEDNLGFSYGSHRVEFENAYCGAYPKGELDESSGILHSSSKVVRYMHTSNMSLTQLTRRGADRQSTLEPRHRKTRRHEATRRMQQAIVVDLESSVETPTRRVQVLPDVHDLVEEIKDHPQKLEGKEKSTTMALQASSPLQISNCSSTLHISNRGTRETTW
nr:hypothetical protein Iba_chr02eCG9350 [Ipomoea batatas]